jgi:ATP-binding cassette subfamily B protein
MIRFDEVSKRYDGGSEALSRVSFELADGEMSFLTGHSGAGKSTLFELLQRFYDPKNGNIKVSGHDIKQLKPQDLRSHLGLVPQQPTLFSADVTHNIR